ncbi:uncharacterized protein DS421_17g586490 [Arachis hypogaea]|nr:uncharacterized protein DS421_17g586490 [Arachis hypogaea]
MLLHCHRDMTTKLTHSALSSSPPPPRLACAVASPERLPSSREKGGGPCHYSSLSPILPLPLNSASCQSLLPP